MEAKVLDIQGNETGRKVKLDNAIFSIEPNDHVIYLDVKRYLTNKRSGTAKSKERAEITGSTRKIKRQKGTGTARAGSVKSPLFRGGGTVFGPKPHNFEIKLNKKVKQLARKSALSYKAKDNGIIVVEDFKFDEPKTKNFANIINNLKINDKKSLLVLSERDNNIYLSSRNLQDTKVTTVSDLNTYDILNHNMLVFNESSIKNLQK
jgi:large subunit ribosomal protein L4